MALLRIRIVIEFARLTRPVGGAQLMVLAIWIGKARPMTALRRRVPGVAVAPRVEATGIGSRSCPARPLRRVRLLIVTALPVGRAAGGDVGFELRRIRISCRGAWLMALTALIARLQRAPLAIIGSLLRRLRLTEARMLTIAIMWRRLLLLRRPRAALLLWITGLSLRIDPGRLAQTVLIGRICSWPSPGRPLERILRGHRETPQYRAQSRAAPNRRFETLAHRIGRLDAKDIQSRFYHRLCGGNQRETRRSRNPVI